MEWVAVSGVVLDQHFTFHFCDGDEYGDPWLRGHSSDVRCLYCSGPDPGTSEYTFYYQHLEVAWSSKNTQPYMFDSLIQGYAMSCSVKYLF